MTDILFFSVGLAFLALGGEWTVRASLAISRKMGFSALLVSTVVIGFGTSVPELVVSVDAAVEGAPDIALGNVVGSNICNTLLILGVAAIVMPISCRGQRVRRNIFAGIAASSFLAVLSFLGEISRPAALLMLAMLAGYLAYSVGHDKDQALRSGEAEKKILGYIEKEIKREKMSAGKTALLAASGMTLLLAGAHLLVTGAVSLAHHFGFSEAVIGLSLAALGTSLPELAAAVAASRKGSAEVVIGNVLGSNLFNILGVLGLTSLIMPLPFAEPISHQDVWIMLSTALLLAFTALLGRHLSRLEGYGFIALYAAYILRLYALS